MWPQKITWNCYSIKWLLIFTGKCCDSILLLVQLWSYNYVHTLLLKRPMASKFLERSLPKSTQPTMLSQKTTWSDFLLIKLHKCTNLESWLTLAKRLRPQFEIFKQIILENSFCCVVTVFLWRLWTWQWPLNQFDRSINSSFHWVGNTLL